MQALENGALDDSVAIVTGASRGGGRGIALVLGEAGATVYVTGRSTANEESESEVSGTIEETAEEVTDRGGVGIPVQCDHTVDGDVEELFNRIDDEHRHVDVLVNNVWGGYEGHDETFEAPFWKQPLWRWDKMFDAGVRAHFTASRLAVPLLVEGSLIVNTTAWDQDRFLGPVPYDVAKAAVNRLAYGMAIDLEERGVTVIALAPGWMRTEAVLESGLSDDELKQTHSVEYHGRGIVALATDDDLMEKTGQILRAGDLAAEYGFTDIDGRYVPPWELPEEYRSQ